MQAGTKIILQRMKDNPEEFPDEGDYDTKWVRIIQGSRNFLPTEDVEALDAGYKQLLIDRYNERVLKTLAGEEIPTTMTIKTEGRYGLKWTDPRKAFQSAVVKGEGHIEPVGGWLGK